jgi:hypothetical protein
MNITIQNPPRPARKRRLESFEPCGPIASMIHNATRKKSRGAKTRLFEDALYSLLKGRFPRLAKRYQALRARTGCLGARARAGGGAAISNPCLNP